MLAERIAHLVAGDVRRFDRLLHVHAELDHVQEELQQVLVLGVAALHRERKKRLPVLQREAGRQCHARPLPRDDHVERIVARVDDELLRALADADSRVTGDDRGNPAARRRHRDHPAGRVGGFDRGGAAPERFVKRGERRGVLRAALGRRHGAWRPLPQERQIGIRAALERIRIARFDVGIVVVGTDQLRALARIILRQQPTNRLVGRKCWIAVVEIAVRKREAHRLIERVNVAGAVVAHRLEIEVLEDVERLEHRGTL